MIEFSQVPEFDFLDTEYRQLFARSDATGFQHPLWLDRVYARLVREKGAEPAILTGRAERDGRLVFVLPLVRRYYGPAAVIECPDMGVSDYNVPVIEPGLAGAISSDRTLRRKLSRALRPFLVSRLQKIRADSVHQLSVLGGGHCAYMGFHAHEVGLARSFAEWRARSLTQSFRRFLDRKRRALLKKTELKFEEVTDTRAIEEAFALLKAFRAQRWKRDLLRDDTYLRFYAEIAASGQPIGLTRTYLFRCGDRPSGVIFGLAHRQRFLVLGLGFDFKGFRNYSLGLLMLESVIEDLIARGDEVCDLTIGDEAYKTDFGTTEVPMLTLWVGPEPLSSVAKLAFDCVIKLRGRKALSRAGGSADHQYALR
ncbi:MAG TPA: GNAT family N-acetyltransferase [Acetobacteraceae bacterium]|nr:GNAT family N-acetyltransferase [Acetobacteraceae bacterium]